MTVIVTGAHGFIGRRLCAALVGDGIRVGGLGHSVSAAFDPELAVARRGNIDVAELDAVATELGSVELVFHLAGGSSVAPSFAAPLEDFRNTVETTAIVAEWLRRSAPQARLVIVSSAAVYGDNDDRAIAETAPIRPMSPYGAHKAMAEVLLRDYGLSFGVSGTIVRLFSVYGPGLAKQLMWDICRRCAAGSTIGVGGTGSERRDWIHVDDAVALLRLAARQASPATPVYNGGTGHGHSVRDAVDRLCEVWGEGRVAVFDGRDRTGNPVSLVADMTRANAVGFVARTDLADGVRDYVDWFRRR